MAFQAPTSQTVVALTSDILRPVNTLTRASPRPGFLDYSTYLSLLLRDGHVHSTHLAHNPQTPAQPVNSALQVVSFQDRTDQKTDFRADQALWSQDNLPHIIYLTRPPSNWIKEEFLKDPPQKTYQIHGKFLRDIPILPDHIATKLEGWRLQAWYCFDPRVKLADILARMGNSVNGSTVQMRSLRFRTDCPALGWANKGPKYDAEKLRIEGLLQAAGLDARSRTTRGLAWGLADPNDGSSHRIAIPAKKGWDCSVEAATATHLIPISSPIAPGLFTSATPAPLPATTSNDRRRPSPTDNDSDVTISDGESDDETHTIPQTGRQRKFVAPVESATKRRNTFDLNPGHPLTWVPARGWQSQPILSFDGRHQTFEEDLTSSGYPAPEEVPRAPSIAFPLEYGQWLANDAQNAGNLQNSNAAEDNDHEALPRVHLHLEAPDITRTYVLYGARWIGLKTLEERQNLTEDAVKLLAGFFPVGTEERIKQLEYLLSPEQACFGFEDRNGQWGATNWDLNSTSNVHYHVSQIEAKTLLVAHSGCQQLQEKSNDEDIRL